MNTPGENGADAPPRPPGLSQRFDLDSLPATMNTALSPRQRTILAWVAADATNIEIADSLDINIKTVEGELTAIYAALGVRGRLPAAVAWSLTWALGGDPDGPEKEKDRTVSNPPA